jgi:hypothetical protein
MTIYALRKRRGHWTVFSGNDVLLDFDDYREAIETTRAALNVLEQAAQANTQGGSATPSSRSRVIVSIKRTPVRYFQL